MKYFSQETTFQNPWEQTVTAVWQRYPNPFSRHVLSEDTIYRRVEGPLLFTKRLLTKTNPLPKWGQRFVSIRHVFIVEESVLDREKRLFTTYTRNIGVYTSTINAVEKCTFREVDGAAGTLLKREAWIDSQLRGFATVLQRFGIERYKHNAANANKSLIYALNRLFPLNNNASNGGVSGGTSSKPVSPASSKMPSSVQKTVQELMHQRLENVKKNNSPIAKNVS